MKKVTLLWTLLLATNAKTFAMKKIAALSITKPTFEVNCIHHLKDAVTDREDYILEVKKNDQLCCLLVYLPQEKKQFAALPENDLLNKALIKFIELRTGKATLLYDENKNFIGEQKEK